MASKFLIVDQNNTVYGIHDTFASANDCIPDTNLSIKEVPLQPCTLIHSHSYEDQLYRVWVSPDIEFWMCARTPYVAMVEACLIYGIEAWTEESCVYEYEHTHNHPKLIPSDGVYIYTTPLMIDILKLLTPENKDICAHLIWDSEDYETLSDWERDATQDALPYGVMPHALINSPTYTAQEIMQEAGGMMLSPQNWMFFEQTGATLSVMQLVHRCSQTSDPMEAIFWISVFSAWGEDFFIEPYAVYLCLLHHKFDDFYDKLKQVRGMLGGS